MSEEALKRLPCAFLTFRDDGTIVSANDKLQELLGYQRAEVEGQRLEALLAPGTRVFYQTHLFPMLKLHGVFEEVYVVLHTREGGVVPVLAYGTRRGELNDCVLVSVTRREQYQDELARARERLIGILGHDLRVPLTAVTLGAETLLRTEELSAAGQQIAMSILASARRAVRMTAELLDFARIRFAGGIPIARQPMDLRVVTEKVIAELRAIHPGVPIELSLEGDCRGCWDADRAAQVVANLAGNAIVHRRDGAVHVRLDGCGESVILDVRNATDFTSAVSEELFSPFRHGVDSAGLGLGLFIVREVMREHGGTVAASAADGEFRVRAIWPRNG